MSARAGSRRTRARLEREGEAHERAGALRLMVFDVDGVLTDGALYIGGDGTEFKAFSTLDGHGVKMLRESGVGVGILTARSSRAVERRAEELGIALLRQGAHDKRAAFAEMLAAERLEAAQAGYMGDDWIDLPVLLRCGFAATVPGAPEEVRARAHFVATRPAGRGAVREVCEFIMRAQGTWERALAAWIA